MSFWKSIKDRATISRQEDEAIHAAAMNEFSSGVRREGLWAKAIIQSDGDARRADACYLRLLASAIRDDIYVSMRMAEVSSIAMRKSVLTPREQLQAFASKMGKTGIFLSQNDGQLVLSVSEDSSAKDAGVKVNDALLEIDGSPCARDYDKNVRRILGPRGSTVRIKVRRGFRAHHFDLVRR